MEAQALEYLLKKEWTKALAIYDKLLEKTLISDQQILQYLLDRCECLHHLGKHQEVLRDNLRAIKLLSDFHDETSEIRARIQQIRAFFSLKRINDGEIVLKEWGLKLKMHPTATGTLEMLVEQYRLVGPQQWLKNMEKQYCSKRNVEKRPSCISCIYCNVSFKDKAELLSHCQTQEHETMIMSDEGHDWHWRAPPRGFKPDLYTICEAWKEMGSCRYGVQCVEAHGDEEFIEWRQRFQYREMKLQRAKEKELYGKSYTEELLERWAQSTNLASIMREKIENVEDSCSCPISATVTSKNSNHKWKFSIKSRGAALKAVALLQDTHRNHFYIEEISAVGSRQIEIKNNQEWISPCPPPPPLPPITAPNEENNHHHLQHHLRHEAATEKLYEITVIFQTTIFGTFRQSVVFDFGSQPVLVKHLCVDVVPDSDIDKINEIRKEITVSISERWTNTNREIVQFSSTLASCEGNSSWEKMLKAIYPCPDSASFELFNSTVSEKKFTRNNYRERMHQLLLIEEIERYNLIAQYNLTTKLQTTHSYLLAPNSTAASTAKYSSNGELFASICLGKELSEDTSEGRLILMHCNTIYLCPLNPAERSTTGSNKVYEALIEDKGKNMIYVRLSADTVRDLKLIHDTELEVQVQFQLNRIPYCEWHYTIDKMPNFKLIFPETFVEPNIPWTPSRQWSPSFDTRLNLKQKEAVVAITTPLQVPLPPILVIGPFGTGKTFTLAQAIKDLIKEDGNKILLCTHSNSAADLYIKDYLDVWVENGNENARPFRIYYQRRWVATVSPVVQKYCSIKQIGNSREFQIPTYEDIVKHKIIVVTLSTSIYLSAMGLPPGTFTHILLDEAAQALECETITPLALANENTRIVLAGDHMQMGPHIFSKFAKDRHLHTSLLERLYDYYPTQFPCKILLCENYRAHESIIQFTSESFYDQKLVSSSKQPKHPKFHPLTFFTTRGEDVQDKNSTAFYNNSEVYEVVDRVVELKRSWPSDWGDFNDQSIGVVTPYADQVFRIRSELKKRKVNVCVERVLNVQGKQFRAIILSTVRTRRTCNDKSTDLDYGFLSNSKLLNTAITRAQSLVAVVGDPIALCSLGRCRKVWERFIQICNENRSLHGISWADLKFQLDGIELKKIYTLNPLAPEFIPRKYLVQQQVQQQQIQQQHMQQQQVLPVVPKQQPPPPIKPLVQYVQPPPPPPPEVPRNFVPGYVQQPNPYYCFVPPTFRPPIPPQRLPTLANIQQPKLIQFMNNVHFPEAHVFNDCISLLPKDMSLAEMVMQPPAIQEQWYSYLLKNVSMEAAQKFKYLLHTTTQKGSRIPESNAIFGRRTPLSADSPTFNWFDSPSNQINMNKPVYMQEEHMERSNPLYKRQSRGSTGTTTVNPRMNGIAVNGRKESELQRMVNEVVTNVNVNGGSCDNWYDVFKSVSMPCMQQEASSRLNRFCS